MRQILNRTPVLPTHIEKGMELLEPGCTTGGRGPFVSVPRGTNEPARNMGTSTHTSCLCNPVCSSIWETLISSVDREQCNASVFDTQQCVCYTTESGMQLISLADPPLYIPIEDALALRYGRHFCTTLPGGTLDWLGGKCFTFLCKFAGSTEHYYCIHRSRRVSSLMTYVMVLRISSSCYGVRCPRQIMITKKTTCTLLLSVPITFLH
jgi:hypothetical protein